MPSDFEAARQVKMRPITDVVADLGLRNDDIEPYGKYKAKIDFSYLFALLAEKNKPRGKLVLVTAITPTKAGEGKTTVSIGLSQAFWKMGVRSTVAIREPSLGPVFGIKGGATGGGCARLLPAEDINLHFTGDMHAIAAANNLLAALADNYVYHNGGNGAGLDARSIVHSRALDINDRALRQIICGLGGKSNGYLRETGFNITAACEVMAVLCLADTFADLKTRLGNIVVGRTKSGEPVTALQLGGAGAMAALLRDAARPNFVQTLEGTPAIVHGGPFGNIAHGCSSVLSLKLALQLAEIVVTEAGFGSDLGFEKFCDIVAAPRGSELIPSAVVLVVTVCALKLHGGVAFDMLAREDRQAVKAGLNNLDRHVAVISQVGAPFVITVNRFVRDTEAEIAEVVDHCRSQGWKVAVNNVWVEGGQGGRQLAQAVLAALEQPCTFQPFYDPDMPILDKLEALAKKIYGAASVVLSREAQADLRWLARHGFSQLPVCVAKTQYSFIDESGSAGGPVGSALNVRHLRLSAGAGFVVAVTGNIMTMPGLPKEPAACRIDVDDKGHILNLF